MKKRSSVLKQEAKAALKGRWKEAVLLNLIPNILTILAVWVIGLVIGFMLFLGMTFFDTSDSSFDTGSNAHVEKRLDDLLEEVDEDGQPIDDEWLYDDADNETTSLVSNIDAGPSVVELIVSGVLGLIGLGISFTLLDVLRRPDRKIRPLKDAFRLFNGKDFVPVALIGIIQYIFIVLWTLLLIIPGIIKGYSYSQAFYIYKDLSDKPMNEKTSALSYISESRQLMNGNKGRLFYIDLSFIGWHILAILTLGLGYLFLNPYIAMTKAAFYRDLVGDAYTTKPNDSILVEE